MEHVVAKPFKTVNRRFAEGEPVTEADIEGALSFDDWKAAGFIAEKKDTPAPSRSFASIDE